MKSIKKTPLVHLEELLQGSDTCQIESETKSKGQSNLAASLPHNNWVDSACSSWGCHRCRCICWCHNDAGRRLDCRDRRCICDRCSVDDWCCACLWCRCISPWHRCCLDNSWRCICHWSIWCNQWCWLDNLCWCDVGGYVCPWHRCCLNNSWCCLNSSWRFLNESWRFLNNSWRCLNNSWRCLNSSWRASTAAGTAYVTGAAYMTGA